MHVVASMLVDAPRDELAHRGQAISSQDEVRALGDHPPPRGKGLQDGSEHLAVMQPRPRGSR